MLNYSRAIHKRYQEAISSGIDSELKTSTRKKLLFQSEDMGEENCNSCEKKRKVALGMVETATLLPDLRLLDCPCRDTLPWEKRRTQCWLS